MTERELSEHAGYLADDTKMRAYREAIRKAVAGGGKIVLDLGSGSGILGLIAAQEGAARVYAVDFGSIIGPAADVAAAAGFGSTILPIRASSTAVELPERVDVVVCDQIGGFVHDAGVLRDFADARRRHLLPNGIQMPSRFRLFVAPATCTRVRSQLDLWTSRPQGVDFSVFAELAVNTEHRVDAKDCRLLSSGIQIAEIASDNDQPFVGTGAEEIDQAGSCDGLIGWFEADLGGGITITNHPAQTGRMKRWCNFYPIASAVHVEPGDEVAVDVDVRPLLNGVTWKVAITRGAGVPKTMERHSTLLGEFLSPDDVGPATDLIRSTQTGEVIARALALADGTRSVDDVLVVLRDEFGESALDRTNMETIRTIVRRFTAPT